MVELTFTPEMREVLAKINGKTLKSFEGHFPCGWGTVITGPMSINLGSFSVELKCEYREVDGWEEIFVYDLPTCLECSESERDGFARLESGLLTTRLVGERVMGVEIVNDRIEVNGVQEASIDTALVIRTKYRTYTLSRGIWFDDAIYLGIGDDVDIRYTKEKCEATWSDEMGDTVIPAIVTRTSTLIKR